MLSGVQHGYYMYMHLQVASTHDTCTHVFVYVQYMQTGTYLLTDTQVAALKVLS